MSVFKKADRRKKKLRLALDGPAGSGKTLTALRFAMVLARHEAAKSGRPSSPKVAVIDTENGSASLYEGDVYDGHPIDFDVIELSEFSPTRYSELTREAGRLGYDVLVIDSLSHAWAGKGGALEAVDRAAERSRGNSFAGWKDVTPLQNEMIDTIIRSSCHVIVTMRTKTEWVLETNERGKSVPVKIGMAPVQRQGVEYEFDVVMDVTEDHTARVSKSRCSAIADKSSNKPGAEFINAVISWLDAGQDIPAEVLEAARLKDVEAAVRSIAAPPAAVNAAVGETDLEARLAAKRAAMGVVSEPAATSPSLAGTTPQATHAVVTATTAAATTPAIAQPATAVRMIEDLQRSAILELFATMAVPADAQADAIKRRGAARLQDLTFDAAKNLLDGLKAIQAQRAPSQPVATCNPATAAATVTADSIVAAAATVAAESPPAETSTASPQLTQPTESPAGDGTRTRITKMITGPQQDRIRKLFDELQVPAEARLKAYQRRGAIALNELTEERADNLIHSLMGRLTGFDQLSAHQPVVAETPQYRDETQRELATASNP